MAGNGGNFNGPRGVPLTAVVANFTDPGTVDPVYTDFEANIDWGDNTELDDGEILADGQGGFTVRGIHEYATAGTFTTTITITDVNDPERSRTLNGTATITAPASTTTISGPTSSVYGQSKTFTVTVSAVDSELPIPTGAVDLFIDDEFFATQSLNASGVASFLADSNLEVSAHAVYAVYSGNAIFDPSDDTLTHTVNKANTTINLASSNPNSSYGAPVSLTATVLPVSPGAGTPTGTVTFTIDGVDQDPISLVNGVATLIVSNLSIGSHQISGHYNGDNHFNECGSGSPLGQTVGQATSVTVASSAPNPSVFGQQVTFTATVSADVGTPTGEVVFYADGNAIGSAGLDENGVASITVSTLAVGEHPVIASYGGDATYGSSLDDSLTQVVNKAGTNISLASDISNPSYGTLVTFSATVTAVSPGAGTPTGTVHFFADGVEIGTGTLANGVATFATQDLTVTTHNITAVYDGDNSFLGCETAVPFQQTVYQASTVTLASSEPNPSVYGQAVVFTATVDADYGTPTGQVIFYADGVEIGSAALDENGQASISFAALSATGHTITAVYQGNTTYGTSSSTGFTQTVLKANTSASVTADVSNATVNQTVTFTAAVAVASPGSGNPLGATVRFFDGEQEIGWGTVDANGQVTWQTSALAVGTHTIRVKLDESANFNASDYSQSIEVTVSE